MKTKYTEIKLWKEHELIVTLVYWVNDFNFSEFLDPVFPNSAGCGKFSLHISYILQVIWITLREKCLYLEFFWSVFSNIRTEYRKMLCISPYSVRMRSFHAVFFWLNFHTMIKGSVERFLYPYA